MVRDDEKTIGLYDLVDKGLEKNIAKENKLETQKMETMAKGFVQDYMNRIIEGRLDVDARAIKE